MTVARDAAVLREAIDWHLALEDGDGDRWHDFVRWLEAAPAHRAAYDHVALDDALLQGRRAERGLALTVAGAPRRRLQAGWAAALVALAAGGGGVLLLRPAVGDRYVVESSLAAGRSVTLSDGTRIALNRASRVTLDRDNPRLALLDRGEAIFTVRHDAADPFRVEAAGRTIEDAGTTFDMVVDRDRLAVAVAEGSVIYQPRDTALLLTPGMTLRSRAGAAAELGQVPADSVGGWRRGQLRFADARLDDVAADVGRSSGIGLQVAPALASRRFSGLLRTDRHPADIVATLAALSGTRAVRQPGGWRLIADRDAAS